MADSPPPFPEDEEPTGSQSPEFAMPSDEQGQASAEGDSATADVDKKLEDISLDAAPPATTESKAEDPEEDLFQDAPSSAPTEEVKPVVADAPASVPSSSSPAVAESSAEQATAVVADVSATPAQAAEAATLVSLETILCLSSFRLFGDCFVVCRTLRNQKKRRTHSA